jgi:hypothetical protein
MTEHKSALGKAIAIWRAGRPIPMTLFAELREQGFDVPALERAYRK